MLIKIVYSGRESEDWIALTKNLHRLLLAEKPDEVVVHIEDLYPDSPEEGTLIRLTFDCFTTIAREFVLEENRQRKAASRHIDQRSLEEVLECENIVDDRTPDYYYLLNERRRVICNAIRSLTATRASALSNREQVRISREAIKAGLCFEHVGNLFISKYRENPHVRAAEVIFVTLPDAPYAELERLADSSAEITRALNHILADIRMDCRACEWKPVCDEVSGMKEMHSKMAEH